MKFPLTLAVSLAFISSGVASLSEGKEQSRTFQLKSPIRTPFHASGLFTPTLFSFYSDISLSLYRTSSLLSQPQENDIVMKLLSKVFPLFQHLTLWWPLKNLA
jgi:hypothetical protein